MSDSTTSQPDEWKPITWTRDVEPGSVLDFSSLLDGPAGKYGRLIVRNGKFAFEGRPEQSVRFYGVNLCTAANFPDKRTCQQLVDRLAACGYNSVRFHHHDHALTATTGERATELDPAEMDKLDYLFYRLKERGIYLTTDLFVSRRPKQIFAALGRPIANFEEFKFLIHLTDDAYQNWEDYSRNFLNHVNPYTSLAWKDDPALITLNCVNEAAIFHCYKNASADVRTIYDVHFETWLSKLGVTPADADERTALLNRFLFETCDRSMKRMRAFIDSLGCKTLITEQNHWSMLPMSLLRRNCDYVDDHFYWDHPEHFPLPSKLLNTSALTDLFSIQSGIVPGRVFGKPYTVSEYNWVYPNQYRGEGAPITAANAALQDWDGLYRFDYLSSAADQEPRGGYFNIAADPINSLSDRIGVLFFLRGDVKKSDVQIPFAVSSQHMLEKKPVNTYPDHAWKLGLIAQVGTVVEADGKLALPAGAKAYIGVRDELKLSPGGSAVPAINAADDAERLSQIERLIGLGQGKLDYERGFSQSTTDEITIDEKALTFTVAAAKSEVLVFCGDGMLTGKVLTATNRSGPAVIFAAAMDQADLSRSTRILLMHLTDVRHHNLQFEENVIKQWGTPPHLVRGGHAKITLNLAGERSPVRVWRLDLSGKRTDEQPCERVDGAIRFTADTFSVPTPTMLYELVR